MGTRHLQQPVLQRARLQPVNASGRTASEKRCHCDPFRERGYTDGRVQRRAELGEQLGYAADTAVAVEMLAWQSAARGLHDDARLALDRARALTDRAGTTSVAAHQAITAAFCALCRGDLVQTAELLEARIAADGGVGPLGEPLGVAPDLVEAYVGLGRADEAAVTPQQSSPLTAALVARCLALASDDDQAAAEAFEAALAAHARAPDAFETARTRLLYGARLRRGGRRVAAREQLRPALDAFAAMDLTAWGAAPPTSWPPPVRPPGLVGRWPPNR